MTVRPSDLYATLGVSDQATQGEIDHAFRALLRRHHPDTRGNLDESRRALADTALQEAFAAYAVLGNPARRLAYDEETTTASRPKTTRAPVVPTRRTFSRPPIVAGPVRWYPAGGGRSR
jgi:DnaJ-class molecular chaperone